MAEPGHGNALHDLKERFCLSEDQLNKEVNEEHLMDVSRIIADHEILGPNLGLTPDDMTAIGKERDQSLKRLEMLKKWKRGRTRKARYRTLIEALLKRGRADRARDLCEFLTHSGKKPHTVSKAVQTTDDEEKLLRQEMELLLEFKRTMGRQPTPPTEAYYVDFEGIKYNNQLNCVSGNTYEVMILVSVGSEFPANLQVQYRVKDRALAEEAIEDAIKTYGDPPLEVPGLHAEAAADLMAIASKRLQDYSGDLVRLCLDVPGKQRSKAHYLKTIEEHIKQCRQPMVVLHYMGHSEVGTGNWCFKDGTISFKEIFDLYRTHGHGKPLIIHSDCCYSGKWTNECAKTLDSLVTPACGHLARGKGILIKVYASCQPDEKAVEPEYSLKGVTTEENRTVKFNNKLSSRQKPSSIDATSILCGRRPNESCHSKNWTWQKEMDEPTVFK